MLICSGKLVCTQKYPNCVILQVKDIHGPALPSVLINIGFVISFTKRKDTECEKLLGWLSAPVEWSGIREGWWAWLKSPASDWRREAHTWVSLTQVPRCLVFFPPCLQCSWASLVPQMVKNPPVRQETCYSWVGKIPWRREWLPTPVFLPGEPRGQRNLVGSIVAKSRTQLSSWHFPGLLGLWVWSYPVLLGEGRKEEFFGMIPALCAQHCLRW